MQTKRILACGVTTAALAVTGVAVAGTTTTTYRGGLNNDPASSVKLRVTQDAGSRYFRAFTIRDLAVRCDGNVIDAAVQRADLNGREPLSDRGRFTASGETPTQTLDVEGRVRRRRASGTVRFSGATQVDGGSADCRSGEVRWSAER